MCARHTHESDRSMGNEYMATNFADIFVTALDPEPR